jgi:hypothetical protein
MAVLVAMGIHGWSDFNLRIPANVFILTALLAIGFCALHLEEGRHHDMMTHGFHTIPLGRGGFLAPALVAVLVIWTGIWTVRHFVAEAYCPTESNPTLNLTFLPSEDHILRAMTWDGENASYPYKRALVLIGIEDREAKGPKAMPGDDKEKALNRDEIRRTIVGALQDAVRLNPLNAEYHVRLAWEYTYLWYRPDYMTKWMPAADTSMERGSHVAGNWAENPHLHLDMGNYWTMRSHSLPPEDPQADVAWTKALWHYRRALALDKGKAAREEIGQFVKRSYPNDEARVTEVLTEVKGE